MTDTHSAMYQFITNLIKKKKKKKLRNFSSLLYSPNIICTCLVFTQAITSGFDVIVIPGHSSVF